MTINADIDKIFKEGLSDYSEKPPVFIWDSIDRTMKRKWKLKHRNFILSIAASSALLISFGAGYFFTKFPYNSDKIAQSNEPPANNTELKHNTLPIQNAVVQPIDSIKNNKLEIPSESVPKATIDLDGTPIEKKESELHKYENDPMKERIVKKANSLGTLMPPSFGDEMIYQVDSLQKSSQVNNMCRSGNKLDRIEPRFPVLSTERNIIYKR